MNKELITESKQFDEFLVNLETQPIFAYDTETNGVFDRFGVGLVGMSFGWEDYACYIPLMHEEGDQLLPASVLPVIKAVLEDPKKEKICHNAKFDEMVMYQYGIDVHGPGHDTIVQAWLLEEEVRKLKVLVEKNLGYKMTTYEEVIESAPKKKGVPRDFNFAKVPLDSALEYAADDAYQTYRLFWHFKKKLQQKKMWDAYAHIEGPFTRVTRCIEQHGVVLDLEAIARADERLPKIIEETDALVYKEAGEVFNIGSPKQLGDILFGKLGIGKNVPRSKKTNNFVTDKKTLEKYTAKHEIVNNVLRRKKIQKTYSTFVTGMRENIAKDGRIHATFNGCGTVTGRLSSSGPNLQNIEGDEVEEVRVRDFFIPAEGCKFVVADYEQVEYRIMAHFSRDKKMTEAFASGHDFHAETARRVFNIAPDEEVKMRQRFIAKSINFGIGYGRGPQSLAETLECSMGEAQAYIDDYYKTFKELAAFKEYVIKKARQDLFVRTLSGRKRTLPDLRSSNYKLRAHAERQAFNTKIQGSAADIIKLAMICLHEELKPWDAHMCIQIHDELVIEVPEEKAEDLIPIVKQNMEYPLKGKNPIRIPLLVNPKIVDRWGDAK